MIASVKPKRMKRPAWKPRHRPHTHADRKKIAAYLRFLELATKETKETK